MTKGGKIQALANTVNDLDREMVKLKTQLEMKQSSLQDEQKRIQTAERNVVEVSHNSYLYASRHLRFRICRPNLPFPPNARRMTRTSLLLPEQSRNTTPPQKTSPKRKNCCKP
jgi:hypothetical protein